MIQAENLVKSFQGIHRVDGVSLQVKKGEIFGLLGPNGAGKTTVIRMLCGIIKADSGSININNTSIEKSKQNFGYVSQYFGQYGELSVWENLNFYAEMYGVKDEKHLLYLLERYQLIDFKDSLAGELSGGFKRRLALVCALAHDPEVLFLDEPTAGIDPVTRKLLWDDFYTLSAEGKSLFVTTHYMEEAVRCHQLAFIAEGKVIAQGTPRSIKHALGDVLVHSIKALYNPDVTDAIKKIKGIILINQFGDDLHIVSEKSVDKKEIEKVISAVKKEDILLKESEPDLEDVFIALTQGRVS